MGEKLDLDQFSLQFVKEARSLYSEHTIPLHRPVFDGNERRYLVECIDSNFVSSVGRRVAEFEEAVAGFTGVKNAVATVNGTSALHVALLLAGVRAGDEVISQALTFIATCNSISYTGAMPVFVDVDLDTMGLSPEMLDAFLKRSAQKTPDGAVNRYSGRRIAACVPMHTFGFPCRIREIIEICSDWGIKVIEDAAESLGSYVGDLHTGTFSSMAALSFNGNKVITTGGGGMILTNDDELALKAKHLTTTGKLPHPYEFVHDRVAYNYRMPNLNAALGCAQMERLPHILEAKSLVATRWESFCKNFGVDFFTALKDDTPNNWLNAIILDNRESRDAFLKFTNEQGVMTRPIWTLMSKLPMFENCQSDGLQNSLWLEDRVVNLPSSVPDIDLV